ncbi:MAG: dinitrogenase iron-molybdenum cofactor biosynthesis protein [Deltaproteobacteria bacterium]|jgi:predicted Fe-Mo cluster-binding NifX family protein|nr:dinitrogenase iron-molybdenum cofactor biosynthesis protein [Deltaproteobacteria bacterium]
MDKTRIAVVSTDGTNVNDHFGKAQRFLIYDCNDKMAFVEERPTETYSVGDPKHSFDAERFGRVSALLKDCTRIYVTQIGEVPASKLKELGIEPVVYEGPIEDIPK